MESSGSGKSVNNSIPININGSDRNDKREPPWKLIELIAYLVAALIATKIIFDYLAT